MTSSVLTKTSGWAAAFVFICMAAVIQIFVKPDAPVTPQSAIFPYSDGELVAFRAFLEQKELVGLYRSVLFQADTVFILLFTFWAWRFHSAMPPGRWRGAGRILAHVVLLCDFSENFMLGFRLGLLGSPSSLSPPYTGTSDIYWVTVFKFVLYTMCLISIFAYTRRSREDAL